MYDDLHRVQDVFGESDVRIYGAGYNVIGSWAIRSIIHVTQACVTSSHVFLFALWKPNVKALRVRFGQQLILRI
jgi:hypothetical protein